MSSAGKQQQDRPLAKQQPKTDRPPSPQQKISKQVDADLRAQLRPELRKLYDLYYKDGA